MFLYKRIQWILFWIFSKYGLISKLKKTLDKQNLRNNSFYKMLKNTIESYYLIICINQLFMKLINNYRLTDGDFLSQYFLKTNKKKLLIIISFILDILFFKNIIEILKKDINKETQVGEQNLRKLIILQIIYQGLRLLLMKRI